MPSPISDELSESFTKEGLQMRNLFKRFISDDSGVTAIEYGLIAALVAVALITALTLLGGELATTFETVEGELATANAGAAPAPAPAPAPVP
jgi:pilus assembly protein Flp/PilA